MSTTSRRHAAETRAFEWEVRARAFQDRMGRVGPQPASVVSFTNRRFTVNFSAPIEHVQRLLPREIEADPIPDRPDLGLLGMCACDFWVTRIGVVPIVPIRNNDMLLRVSTRFRKGGHRLRGFYTIHSTSSSFVLGTLGRHFSHFRKQRGRFERVDDRSTYSLRNARTDELSTGWVVAHTDSIDKTPPRGSCFTSIEAATDYVFRLDGSCGFDWATRRISFQPIEYPEWDLSFCQRVDYGFPLLDTLAREFELDLSLDSTLCMQDTHQTWCASTLYRNENAARPWFAKRRTSESLARIGGHR
ncbi:MAG: hypothetical protein ACKVWV_05190 [Planctomycetota bacterium]